jgi:hypothetical protein
MIHPFTCQTRQRQNPRFTMAPKPDIPHTLAPRPRIFVNDASHQLTTIPTAHLELGIDALMRGLRP